MNKVELSERINSLRRRNPEYRTNLFLSLDEIIDKINSGAIKLIDQDNLLLFLMQDDDLLRVYFCCKNEDAVRSIRTYIPKNKGKPVIDVIGKGQDNKNLANLLVESGFKIGFEFIRMSTKSPILPAQLPKNIEFATSDDVHEINEIIRTTFESVYSHFPPVKELIKAIQAKEIQVVRQENQIAALAYIAKESARTHCLRYFIARPEYRGKGYANQLLRAGFENIPENGTFYLWIGTYNPTVQKYEKYGLTHDGLTDYILVIE